MKIAILTGASSGLGRAFAGKIHEVFPEIDEIWLVARRTERLEALAAETNAVRMVPVPCDLLNEESYRSLIGRLQAEKPEVRLLINNAGCGFLGAFADSNEDEQLRSIDLNVRALTRLTRAALPYMPRGARVLNTSSIASFSPNPNMAVYSATKAYVTFFSRALNDELRASGRSCTAVCPAPMNTEFLTLGRVAGHSRMFERLPYETVDEVSLGALKAAKKRKAVYTPRAFYRFYHFLCRILPDALLIRLGRT